MKHVLPDLVERGRFCTEIKGYESRPFDDYGMFELKRKGISLRVMMSSGGPDMPWEHVSVSTSSRCPTWDEMCWIKDLFFEKHETVVQYHPAESDYVNYHPFCLHLWRPLNAALPIPPSIAVGPKDGKAKGFENHEG
jgi:hypothetical protein